MTPEQPEAREPKDESSPPLDPRDEAAEESRATAPGIPRLALVGGLVIGAVVAATLLMSAKNPEPAPDAAPVRGAVCPYLRDAFDQLVAGNTTAFAETVRIAAREAELTLERSDELFGLPEEIALRLREVLDDGGDGSARALIDEAKRACEDLGRWGYSISNPSP